MVQLSVLTMMKKGGVYKILNNFASTRFFYLKKKKNLNDNYKNTISTEFKQKVVIVKTQQLIHGAFLKPTLLC